MKLKNMDDKTIEVQKLVVRNYIDDINVIPPFIDSTKFAHKKCFGISTHMLTKLGSLLDISILNKKKIDDIASSVFSHINEIFDIDPLIGMEYFLMINDISEFYKELCIDNELYETAENLNKFLEILKKIKK